MSLASSHLDPDPSVPPAETWRWGLRRQLAEMTDLLLAETPEAYDGGLVAREARGTRERTLLLRRAAALASVVHVAPEPVARAEVQRLVGDVERHRRRARDRQWDSVQLELGGSE